MGQVWLCWPLGLEDGEWVDGLATSSPCLSSLLRQQKIVARKSSGGQRLALTVNFPVAESASDPNRNLSSEELLGKLEEGRLVGDGG